MCLQAQARARTRTPPCIPPPAYSTAPAAAAAAAAARAAPTAPAAPAVSNEVALFPVLLTVLSIAAADNLVLTTGLVVFNSVCLLNNVEVSQLMPLATASALYVNVFTS
jgi:hypothetical protein